MNDRLINLILGSESEVSSRIKTIILNVALTILSIELAVYAVKANGYTIVTLTFDIASFIKLFSEYYIFGFLLLVGGIMFVSAIGIRILQGVSIIFWSVRYRYSKKSLIKSGNFWFDRIQKDRWETLLNSRGETDERVLEVLRLMLLAYISNETIIKDNFQPFYSERTYAFFIGFMAPGLIGLGKDYFVREYMRKKVRRLKKLHKRSIPSTT